MIRWEYWTRKRISDAGFISARCSSRGSRSLPSVRLTESSRLTTSVCRRHWCHNRHTVQWRTPTWRRPTARSSPTAPRNFDVFTHLSLFTHALNHSLWGRKIVSATWSLNRNQPTQETDCSVKHIWCSTELRQKKSIVLIDYCTELHGDHRLFYGAHSIFCGPDDQWRYNVINTAPRS